MTYNLKEYVVCEEIINGKSIYTIRTNTDCSPTRFNIMGDFDSYDDARIFQDCLYFPLDYLNID